MGLEGHRLDESLARELNGLRVLHHTTKPRPHEQLAQDDAEREDVGAAIPFLTLRDLGSHRCRPVGDELHVANAGRGDLGHRGLEVADLHLASPAEQHLPRAQGEVEHVELHATMVLGRARTAERLADLRGDEERQVQRQPK